MDLLYAGDTLAGLAWDRTRIVHERDLNNFYMDRIIHE